MNIPHIVTDTDKKYFKEQLKEDPYIGYADREYDKWFAKNPVAWWEDISDGAEKGLQLAIDEEVLTKIYTESKIDFNKTYCSCDQEGRIQFVIDGVKMKVSCTCELIKDLLGAYPLDGWNELESILITEFKADQLTPQNHIDATKYARYFIESLKMNNMMELNIKLRKQK